MEARANFLKQGWAQGKKKKPEVQILGDYCWRKYNIFYPKKSLISG